MCQYRFQTETKGVVYLNPKYGSNSAHLYSSFTTGCRHYFTTITM
ncbi:unnamed protein product [Chondrus crispus]|uniref:Uncharacterized protein n=1 Tax=Chondrus crispus TaxID=2769 RepID=S0F342_CHOCR|nr:unnamed protein product [Chondrus crispus]CDF77377.1 unnamed protein product [Chondrus crispus]|eukprot:XP_005712251.1 unnamed protein product [Chondrus crispus]